MPIQWPTPPTAEAFHGPAGEIVRAIEPHSEADPVAILAQVLTAFGNIVGRGPHFRVEADTHYTNLFVVLVGATSKGRKGSSWGQARLPFRTLDPAWHSGRVQGGLSSGEGLIWAARDKIERQEPIKENGRTKAYDTVMVDPGIADKRLLVLEPEFASVLRIISREGNILSAVIRQAWDTGDLRALTKTCQTKATGAHISIIGHITRDELLRYLDRTEAANGFANRFLWLCVQRSKILPEGGRLSEVDFGPIVRSVGTSMEFAHSAKEIERDPEAREIWQRVYEELSEGRPGLLGAVISRAEAQVTRLACIYALLDRSTLIRGPHLLAALALWEYCEASCRFIFGDVLGDPVADELLRALRSAPDGLSRTQIRDHFGRNRGAPEIGRVLRLLAESGLARMEGRETGGRTEERWFAVRRTVGSRGTTETTETT